MCGVCGILEEALVLMANFNFQNIDVHGVLFAGLGLELRVGTQGSGWGSGWGSDLGSRLNAGNHLMTPSLVLHAGTHTVNQLWCPIICLQCLA